MAGVRPHLTHTVKRAHDKKMKLKSRKICPELAAFPGVLGRVLKTTSKSTPLGWAWEIKGDAEITKTATAHSYLRQKV